MMFSGPAQTTTGAGTSIGDIGFSNVFGLNFVGSTLYGFTSFGETLIINTSTGAGTLVAVNNIAANGADGVNPIPEPATFALFATGLFSMFVISRRRNRKCVAV